MPTDPTTGVAVRDRLLSPISGPAASLWILPALAVAFLLAAAGAGASNSPMPGDMLSLVRSYIAARPHNSLARFLPALRRVNGTASHRGLGRPFVAAWRRAADDPVFRRLQRRQRDRRYFNPAVRRAEADGLGTLGQFIYYDAMVMHGPGTSHASFGGLRARAAARARTPARGGSEVRYLNAFLSVRRRLMRTESKHGNTSRIDGQQRVFVRRRNLDLDPPLVWHVYGDRYAIRAIPEAPAARSR